MTDERESALAALRAVKNEVLPFVRHLEQGGAIDWYSFLIHDRDGGVPTTDDGAYIHLRVSATNDRIFVPERWNGDNWKMIRRMSDVGDTWPWWLLGEQSALLLAVVEHNQHLDDMPLLIQIGQFLHYYSNMTQLPFPRPTWVDA